MSLQASEALPLEPPVQKWGRWIGVALGMGIFALALFALREQFATYNVREIRNAMRDLDTPFIVRATLYAIAAYAVLVTYDILALRYIKHQLPAPRVAFISAASARMACSSATVADSMERKCFMALGRDGKKGRSIRLRTTDDK